MNKVIDLKTSIKAIIVILTIAFLLTIFPMKLWYQTESYGTPSVTGASAEVVNYRNKIKEIFVANGSHLETLRVYFNEGTYDDDFTVYLYDGAGKLLAEEVSKTPESRTGYADVIIDVDLEEGALYIITFDSMQSLYIGLEDYDPSTGVMVVPYYNDAELTGKALTLDFVYRENLSISRLAALIVGALLAMMLLLAITDAVFMRLPDEKNRLTTVENSMKRFLNPLTAVFLLFCLIMIFMGKVSIYTQDNIFAVISVILLGFVLFYGINHKRAGMGDGITVDYLRNHASDIVMSLGIAYALQGCCEYVAALYDIDHYVAMRKELIGFGIALIAMFAAKEIYTIYNLLIVVAGTIAGVIYCNKNITDEMTKDERFLFKGNVIIAILLAIILVRTVLAFIKKRRLPKLNVAYSAITAVYFALIVIFRNTRWWTVILVVSLVLMMITYGLYTKKDNFLTNVLRGIVIQFIMLTLWTLWHRPYTAFRTARFPHFFHTETVTATYLTMVSVAVLVLLISKIRTTSLKLANIWKELALLGIVLSYMIFTMARTAFASVIVSYIFIFCMCFIRRDKDRSGAVICGIPQNIKTGFKTLLYVIVGVIVMFPITFEAQRTIPALVSDPYEYDIEDFEEETARGRRLTSSQYMTIGRLGVVFGDKILGMDLDPYLAYYKDDYNFNEYHATLKEMYENKGYHFTGFDITDEMWETTEVEINSDYFVAQWSWWDPEVETLEEADLRESARMDEMNAEAEAEALAETSEVSEDGTQISEVYSEEGSDGAENIDEASSESGDDGEETDYTNGRLDIYKSYIEQLNLTGHDSMGAILKDGSEATHAHDVYLQVAFDHGVIAGIVFVIFGIATFIMSIIYFKRSEDKYRALGMGITVAFAVAGVVEWVYHFAHPIALVLLLTIVPYIFVRDEHTPKSSES